MRDSGGLRSEALPARLLIHRSVLDCHCMSRRERLLGVYLKHDVVPGCQIKLGYKILWLRSLFNNNTGIFKCLLYLCKRTGECLRDIRCV